MPNRRHRLALPDGFRLGRYILQDQLGAGGFGITYLGVDSKRDRRVAIKELLPSSIVTRCDGVQVAPHSEAEVEVWKWAQESFAVEADTVAACRHPNVLQVYEVFRANGTVYMVSRFEEGGTLAEWLDECKTMPESELMTILRPLLSALETVHGRGFLHRDIKPDNIYLSVDGRPILIDFGSARQIITNKGRAVTTILTHGYSPIEQYSSVGDQGPWTDIYSLGAVMYRAITGSVPDDARRRMTAKKDPCACLASAYRKSYDPAFLKSIDQALVVDERQRTRSISVWVAQLEKAPPAVASPVPPQSGPPVPPGNSIISQRALPVAPHPSVPAQRAPAPAYRTGNDVHCTVPVSPTVARHGGVQIVNLGKSKLRLLLPPATAEGAVFRVRGLGLPHHAPPAQRGDLYVKVTLHHTSGVETAASKGSPLPVFISLFAPGLGSLRRFAALPCLLFLGLVAMLHFKWLANRVEDAEYAAVALAAILLQVGSVVLAGRSSPMAPLRFWPGSSAQWGASGLLSLALLSAFFLGHAPGDRWMEDDIAFRWCPPGTFLMGSPDGQGEADERPQHRETIAHGFWIAETELTREQWARVMSPSSGVNRPTGARMPITDVRWADCDDWCHRQNAQLKLAPWRFDLPTQIQWEYACRSGTSSPFATSTGRLDPSVANYDSGGGRKLALQEVGQSNHANAWNIYDMHGNVWEWCRDLYHPYPGSSLALAPMTLSDRVCRGGSYLDQENYCRSAKRYHDAGRMGMPTLGFRPVLTRE